MSEARTRTQPGLPASARVPASATTQSAGGSAEALARIEARLGRIEATLERASALADQLPGLVATAADAADGWAQEDGRLDARLRAATVLLERVSRPEVLGALEQVVGQLEAAPGLVATAGDMVDELARHAAERGIDLHAATENAAGSLTALLRALSHPETRAMLTGGVLSPEALRTVNLFAASLAEAAAVPPRPVGLWGTLSRLGDADVKHALGLLLSAAKSFGQRLRPAKARLRADNPDPQTRRTP